MLRKINKIAIGALTLLTLLTPVSSAVALTLDTKQSLIKSSGPAGYSGTQDLADVIGLLISVLIGLLGIIFLLLTIYAGFMWMTAAGDAKKVETAKSTLARAVIGLVIILSAYAITQFVVGSIAISNDSPGL